MYTATITQKGQFTLPLDLRYHLGVKPYDKIILKKHKAGIQIEAAPDFFDLAGTLKPKSTKSILKAREAMEKNYERV